MNDMPLSLLSRRFALLFLAALPILSSCNSSIANKMPDPPLDPNNIQVSTISYDTGRTGTNSQETILNQSNVKPGMFGKIGELLVDDQIYAGLLYISGLTVNGLARNVLYAATVNNTVYAFDADKIGAPLWIRNFNRDFNSAGSPSSYTDVNFNGQINFNGNIGIVGTPVIDISTNTMYFLTRTEEDASAVQRLWAIDITNGKNRVDPVMIVSISNEYSATMNNQRASLAISNGAIYVAWASFGDAPPYHGIVKGYDSKTLALTGTFNDTPSGELGGIWMAGGGPALDAEGNLYYATGNGTWNGNDDFGVSVVKLKSRTLDLLDWFTPYDWDSLNAKDADLGAGFPVILPGLNKLVISGKGSKMYLLNADNLGKVTDMDTQIPQSWSFTGEMHHAIAAWSGPKGVTLYTWNAGDSLRAYRYDSSVGKFILPSIAESMIGVTNGIPGAMLAVSSNGTESGTGIVWATIPTANALTLSVPGKFFAFSAEEQNGELPLLWSNDAPADDIYNFSKGSPPLVVNGKVYVSSLSGIISVYGLK